MWRQVGGIGVTREVSLGRPLTWLLLSPDSSSPYESFHAWCMEWDNELWETLRNVDFRGHLIIAVKKFWDICWNFFSRTEGNRPAFDSVMLELFRQKKKQRNNWLTSSGFPTEVTPGAEVLVLFAEACTLEAGEARVCGYLIGKCRLRTDARNGLPRKSWVHKSFSNKHLLLWKAEEGY